jgi:hypothetical protein
MKISKCIATAIMIGTVSVAQAKVGADQAARLAQDLTPLGAERAGNAAGSIPAWTGGLFDPSHKAGTRYSNPFAADKPEFVISRDNFAQHKERLSAGQLAMFGKFPAYTLPVYATRRTAAAPKFIYEATAANAVRAELANNGDTLSNAITGIPFPIPGNGQEVIWNHKTRYRGLSVTRYNMQAAVQANGTFTVFKLKEDVKFSYSYPDQKPSASDNVLVYFLQQTLSPPRQAGGILLVHDTMDQVKDPRRAWQYNPGQRRLRRAPNVGYDNPGNGSDGLRTNDQLDSFNGAMDRYTWKLAGKKEMYVPYNAYELHDSKYGYKDILRAGHINQGLARYELHRVWVVQAELKAGTSHIYKRRTFYVDEDSWSILLTDIYDARDQLWRFQESHTASAYDFPATALVLGVVYDLFNGRYLTMDMNNEEPESVRTEFAGGHFDPGNVSKLVTK